MPTFISLVTYEESGIADIEASPERLAQAREVCAAYGGELQQFFLSLGRYDAVAISEFPDNASATKALLAIAKGGSVSTETLTAFTESEYEEIVTDLP